MRLTKLQNSIFPEGVQLRIIKSLVGGTRIVNLDESIAYYESIVKKYNQPLQ